MGWDGEEFKKMVGPIPSQFAANILAETIRRCIAMDGTVDTADNGFIYINWRGRSFLIDERYANGLRNYLVEESECTPEEVSDLTPEKIIRDIPAIESIQRLVQLEEMWEMPEARTDR